MGLQSGSSLLPGNVQDALSRIGFLLDTLLKGTEDAIFLMDGLVFKDCNPATLRMFGCRAKDEIVGHTLLEFSPIQQGDGTASAERAKQLLAAALDGVPQHFEWRHRRLDGAELDVEVRLNLFSAAGAPFALAVVRDVSARKRAEATVRRQLAAGELINGILARGASCAPSEIDELTRDALRQLAEFTGADHAYFFVSSPDGATYSCTHEWCASGVAPLRDAHQNVAAGAEPWIEKALLRREVVRVDSLASEPAAPPARHADPRSDPGCRSRLIVPASGRGDQLVAAIGLDSHLRDSAWPESTQTLCAIVGNGLAGMMVRKTAEERVLRQRHFMERLIDSLPCIFYLYDSNLRLRRWNQKHEANLGYTAEELAGKSILDLLATEESRQRALDAWENLKQGGPTDFAEVSVLHKDGSVRLYLVSGSRVDSEEGPMFLGVGCDLTARLQAERALATSERNYRELFNATNDALIICDAAGRLLDLNDRACALFGCTGSQARGVSLDDVSFAEPPYSRADALEKLGRAVHEGPQIFDWLGRRHDGGTVWCEAALRGFEINDEQRVIASLRDIADRKLAALERERLMAEAHAANAAKDEFLAVLSHELRNPLAAIQASIGVLRQLSNGGEPRTARAVDVIERNVRLQARLVNDLLDLSHLVRGKLQIQRAPLQLEEVVLSAVQACRADADRAGVSLETHVGAGVWVDADADRIQQVVINLIDNAIKFTPRGGRVTTSVVGDRRHGQVIVEDTGLGIEHERLPEIFEMFRQGEIAARRAPGLGIGLALVKSITQLHGGAVRAESGGPGLGSRFIVELPATEAPAAAAAGKAADPERASYKLLLLEDNEDTRSMLMETFMGLGYQVSAAESAEVALDLLARETPDVILADVGLPGMDGYEFLRHARHLPSAAHALALVLTGHGQPRDIQRAREAGYDDHFVKPADIGLIHQRIRSGLTAASGEVSARHSGA